jgi:AcrR family transcriptional regulator
MARWRPGAEARLQQAALALFQERGYEQTTTAEIAEAAGLTQRTFFRYFRDKRDVLFQGQDEFVESLTEGVDAAPAGTPTIDLVELVLTSAAPFFTDERRPYSRARRAVIDGNPALRERENHKLASLASGLAEALRRRGISEPAALLAAEAAVSIFKVAFAHWLREDESRPFAVIVADVTREWRGLSQAPGEVTGSVVTRVARSGAGNGGTR